MSLYTSSTTRRDFLKNASVGAVGVPAMMSSGRVMGAGEQLNIAAVGVGGKGRTDIRLASRGHRVVAICDVDSRTLATAAKTYPGAKTYQDWRRMLEQKDIDAVTVSTPDHMHAPIAVSAMQLGKHVYVQKPLAHTVFEARQMAKVARHNQVMTQMGNQHHSGTGYLTLVQLIQEGVIGKIKEAHTWSNRPIWPQGIRRSKQTDTPPDWLQWDLWLGVAPARPYVGPVAGAKRGRGAYHPFNWRGWLDFGVGALGDMGCHIIDPVIWSLELGAPRKVWSEGPATNGETYPEWETIRYQFAGTQYTTDDTVTMTWYDGGKKPPRDLVQLPAGEELPSNGVLMIGEKGAVVCAHTKNPYILYQGMKIEGFDLVPAKDHYQQWTDACLGKGTPSSNFDYAGPLTETVLLGTIAVRLPGEQLRWNSKELKFDNAPQANAYLHHEYRKGWEVDGLT